MNTDLLVENFAREIVNDDSLTTGQRLQLMTHLVNAIYSTNKG